jgi:hypothetical protein
LAVVVAARRSTGTLGRNVAMGEINRVLGSDAFVVFVLAWVAGWLLISFLVRRAQGKPFFAPAAQPFQFSEKWASGRSLDTWWSRLGRARNCLFIGVGDEKLFVQPHFPFTLGFIPEIYRLEHAIPLTRITKVTPERSLFRNMIRVEYSDPDGRQQTLELKLRHPEGFLSAVHDHVSVAA